MANTEEGEKGKSNIFFKIAENVLLGIFYLTKFLSRILPPQILYSLFDSFGTVVFYALPGVSQRLQEKIREALPEITDDDEIKSISRQAYGSFIRPMLDLVLLWRYGDRIMREMSIEGMENLEKADAEGKGVILLFAHTGCFDIFAPVMTRLGKTFTPIIFNPLTTPVPRYIITLAIFGQMLGCDPESPVFWTGKDTVRKVREHLKKGKRVGITFDVDGKCVVQLFGRPAALTDGIAHFAIDTGAPVVPYCLLHGDKVFSHRLIIEEPLQYELSGDRKRDIQTITRKTTEAGEKQIRYAPGQWMSWFGIRHWWEMAEKIVEEGK